MAGSRRPVVAVVGAGPAGLAAAEILATGGCVVTVYEHMASPGRKLLLAGRSGLNLTNDEPIADLIARCTTAGAVAPAISAALTRYRPADLRAWAAGLGQDTFVGTSGRVFPVAWRAAPLLRAWMARLAALGVTWQRGWHWQGWDGPTNALSFRHGADTDTTDTTVTTDATVLALGGASWPRTGSTGTWAEALRDEGITVRPIGPANAAVQIPWSTQFRDRFAGEPLKHVAVAHGGRSIRGEVTVTRAGLEGTPVYTHAASIGALDAGPENPVVVRLDLRADMDATALAARLARSRRGDSRSTILRKAGLTPTATGVVHEAFARGWIDAVDLTDPHHLAMTIKAVALPVVGVGPLERAISSSGGVALDELDDHFMLRRRPGTFVAGEMIDLDAPTGGYLLQVAFSTGVAAAHGALEWLSVGGALNGEQ